MLKLTQQEYETVPVVIKAEVLLASVVCMWGKPKTNVSVCCQLAHSNELPICATARQLDLNDTGQCCMMRQPLYQSITGRNCVSAGSLRISGDFKPVSSLKYQR